MSNKGLEFALKELFVGGDSMISEGFRLKGETDLLRKFIDGLSKETFAGYYFAQEPVNLKMQKMMLEDDVSDPEVPKRIFAYERSKTLIREIVIRWNKE